MDALYEAFVKIQNQNLYIRCEPEVLDFTSKRPGKLIIETKAVSLEIPFGDDLIKLKEYLGILQLYLGGKDSVVMTWNLKNFLSYVRGKTGVDFNLNGSIFDLSFLESYFGENNTCPKSFEEASQRLKKLIGNNNWSRVNKVYKEVYLPLIKLIPKIETYGLSHKQKRSKVYPAYTIDGQINGRMKCSNIFSSSYNPHSLGFEEKENLKAPGFDYCFLSFDFKHMEVSVLQWLSNDDFMGEILNSGKDFYEAIWEILTQSSCNADRRQLCKDFFLPVFYGAGADALAQRLKWPSESCKTLINRIHKTLPMASNWILNQQRKSNGEAVDCYARRRSFDSAHKVRNFVVQSPASLVCLHKLVLLMQALGDLAAVCMHIHDGYVLSVKKENLFKTYKLTKQILESENDLYPGLKLKTGCKMGVNLNELILYP